MCMDFHKICSCGREEVSFMFRDEVMPTEVIDRLYCPSCSQGLAFDDASMVNDNGWVIKYDMDVAKFAAVKLPKAEVTPEFIFDRGYCTWRGMYPHDHLDSAREREKLVELSRVNPKKYLEEFKKWGIERVDGLEREGWRKAHAGQ